VRSSVSPSPRARKRTAGSAWPRFASKKSGTEAGTAATASEAAARHRTRRSEPRPSVNARRCITITSLLSHCTTNVAALFTQRKRVDRSLEKMPTLKVDPTRKSAA
jgi:hypothetical protein